MPTKKAPSPPPSKVARVLQDFAKLGRPVKSPQPKAKSRSKK